MELKWVLQTVQEFLKQQISEFSNQFSKLKSSFKTEIKFSNHKSNAKSICYQITYAETPCDGPLGEEQVILTIYIIYRAAQNFGGRKLWRIWRISSEPSKFYPPNSVNSRISESLFKQPPKFYPPIISHY